VYKVADVRVPHGGVHTQQIYSICIRIYTLQ
jgi:hypothetical protein